MRYCPQRSVFGSFAPVNKVLLLSIIAATIAVPAVAARDQRPLRGLRKALLAMLAFEVAYFAFLRLFAVAYRPG